MSRMRRTVQNISKLKKVDWFFCLRKANEFKISPMQCKMTTGISNVKAIGLIQNDHGNFQRLNYRVIQNDHGNFQSQICERHDHGNFQRQTQTTIEIFKIKFALNQKWRWKFPASKFRACAYPKLPRKLTKSFFSANVECLIAHFIRSVIPYSNSISWKYNSFYI